MRIRGLAAAAALLALALAMTGCTKSAPKITDAQVEEWRALAAETIPAATEVTIDVHRDATMAGLSNSVDIEVSFASFADLKASDQALVDLKKTLEDQARSALVDMTAVTEDAEAHGAMISAQLVDAVGGLTGATVLEGPYYFREDGRTPKSVKVLVYVDDSSVIDLPWLDRVADVAQSELADVGGRFDGIWILPGDDINRSFGDPDFEASLVQVGTLAAIKAFGDDKGCVRTDAWAYDVSGTYVVPYAPGESGGACA